MYDSILSDVLNCHRETTFIKSYLIRHLYKISFQIIIFCPHKISFQIIIFCPYKISFQIIIFCPYKISFKIIICSPYFFIARESLTNYCRWMQQSLISFFENRNEDNLTEPSSTNKKYRCAWTKSTPLYYHIVPNLSHTLFSKTRNKKPQPW